VDEVRASIKKPVPNPYPQLVENSKRDNTKELQRINDTLKKETSRSWAVKMRDEVLASNNVY
jgi:hypothetical protein